MDQQRVLIVDQDHISRLKSEVHLQQAGYTIVGVESGEAAIDLLSRERYDLMITELTLPNISGMQLIAEARSIDAHMAMMIITGASSAASAIAALNQEVRCYLLKPVTPHELLHNVARLLAQHGQIAERSSPYITHRSKTAEPNLVCVGPLQIDRRRRRVTRSGAPIVLTHTEFSLLDYFVQHRGRVISPLEIARHVLNYACSLQEARNLSKGHIHRLRQKIEAPSPGPSLIRNIRGAGYRLADEDELQADDNISH